MVYDLWFLIVRKSLNTFYLSQLSYAGIASP
jgi:hypothetical protein